MEERNYNAPYQDPHYYDEDEIDIMELVRKALKNWKFILKCCGVAAVVGLIVGFSIPKTYTVSATLAPETVSKSAGGSLSSLAAMAGINLSSTTTADAFYPELYPQIVNSNPFIVGLFSVPVEFEYKKETVQTDLYTYLKEYTSAPWWNAILKLPGKAIGAVMGIFREKEEPVEGYANINPQALTLEQEKLVKAIKESISITVDKKTSLISISVVTQNPDVAYTLAKEVISSLQNFVTDYRTQKSRKDLEYYQSVYDDAKEDYYAAQQKYARYVDANQGVTRQSVMIEQQRLQNESELAYQLYNSCAQQLESAKVMVQKETPVFAEMDPPTRPTKKTAPSKAKILVIMAFLGAVVGAVWAIWGKDWLAGFKNSVREDQDKGSEG